MNRRQVSTPEATAIDLLCYASSAGGIGNVATDLAELSEQIVSSQLAEAARTNGEIRYAQRLGYLLDLLGESRRTKDLAKLIANKHPGNTALIPGHPTKGCTVNHAWHVIVNEQVVTDL